LGELDDLRLALKRRRREALDRARRLAEEEGDVDRVQRPGVIRLYHALMGSLEQVEQREISEAEAARDALDEAQAAVTDLEQKITALEQRQSELKAENAARADRLRSRVASMTSVPDDVANELASVELYDALMRDYSDALEALQELKSGAVLLRQDAEKAEWMPDGMVVPQDMLAHLRQRIDALLPRVRRAEPDAGAQLQEAARGLGQQNMSGPNAALQMVNKRAWKQQHAQVTARIQSVAIGLDAAVIRANRAVYSALAEAEANRAEHLDAAEALLS